MLYLPLLCEILDNMYIVTGSNIITFKIKLIVLIKPFFLHDLKVKTNILKMKRTFMDTMKDYFCYRDTLF